MHDFKNQNEQKKSKNDLISGFYQLNQRFLQFKPLVFTVFIRLVEGLVLADSVQFLKL